MLSSRDILCYYYKVDQIILSMRYIYFFLM